MTKDEALKLGLQLVEAAEYLANNPAIFGEYVEKKRALKRALIQQSKIAFEEALAQPEQEFFVVKHYSADERPIIKGNGFDGLEIGTDREDAEEFIKWVNARISTPPQREPLTDEQLIAAYESEQQGRYGDHIRSLRAIEAAHGIKGE